MHGYLYCIGCSGLIWAPPGAEHVCPECKASRAAEAATRVDGASASDGQEVGS